MMPPPGPVSPAPHGLAASHVTAGSVVVVVVVGASVVVDDEFSAHAVMTVKSAITATTFRAAELPIDPRFGYINAYFLELLQGP
jgi:hypothetical protein